MGCSKEGPSDDDPSIGLSESYTSKEVNQLFRAVANKHRRVVVQTLDETHTPVTRSALATYIAKEVLPESERANFFRFRRRVVAGLHHVHLPVLERAEIIEIDAGQILLGRNFPQAVTLVKELS